MDGTLSDSESIASRLWNAAAHTAQRAAERVGAAAAEGVEAVREAVEPGGAVFEAVDAATNLDREKHAMAAGVMDDLKDRGAQLAEGAQAQLKEVGEAYGNVAYAAMHPNEPGSRERAAEGLDKSAPHPLETAEKIYEGTAAAVYRFIDAEATLMREAGRQVAADVEDVRQLADAALNPSVRGAADRALHAAADLAAPPMVKAATGPDAEEVGRAVTDAVLDGVDIAGTVVTAGEAAGALAAKAGLGEAKAVQAGLQGEAKAAEKGIAVEKGADRAAESFKDLDPLIEELNQDSVVAGKLTDTREPLIPRTEAWDKDSARAYADQQAKTYRKEADMAPGREVQAGHTAAARHAPESGISKKDWDEAPMQQLHSSSKDKSLKVEVTDQHGKVDTRTRHTAQEGLIDDAVERVKAANDGKLTPRGHLDAADEVTWRTLNVPMDQRAVDVLRGSGTVAPEAAPKTGSAIAADAFNRAADSQKQQSKPEAPPVRPETQLRPEVPPMPR